MTWITDGWGTRWVPMQPRKRRKPGRALRFAELKAGDILIHRSKSKVIHNPRKSNAVFANDDYREVIEHHLGFAVAEDRWFDPVAGQDDEVAGQMVGVRPFHQFGPGNHKRTHTLRGLAQNGYHPTTPEQAQIISKFFAERAQIVADWDADKITDAEAKMRAPKWSKMLRDCGLDG